MDIICECLALHMYYITVLFAHAIYEIRSYFGFPFYRIYEVEIIDLTLIPKWFHNCQKPGKVAIWVKWKVKKSVEEYTIRFENRNSANRTD